MTRATNHDWIQTFTGRQFFPLEPRAEDLCLDDIAHALAMQCRFAGHVAQFYSVAQHSVLVSRLMEERARANRRPAPFTQKVALAGLLHDASEAYLVDLPRPLKRSGALGDIYKSYERELQAMIYERFEVPEAARFDLDFCDAVLLATEKRDLMAREPAPWMPLPDPLEDVLFPVPPEIAEAMFLRRYEELTA